MKKIINEQIKTLATEGLANGQELKDSELMSFISSNHKCMKAIVDYLAYHKVIEYNKDLKRYFAGELKKSTEYQRKKSIQDKRIEFIYKKAKSRKDYKIIDAMKDLGIREPSVRNILSKSKVFKVKFGCILLKGQKAKDIEKESTPIEPTNKPNIRYIENPKLETYDMLFMVGTDAQKELLYNYCINQGLFKHTDKLSYKIEAVEIHDKDIQGYYKGLLVPSW